MRIAYLIDKPAIGGGMEYIRRHAENDDRNGREWRVFYSSCHECTVSAVNEWHADEIVVNHLRALLQLLYNPWRRPKGRVTFVVHGLHIRKYEWMRKERGWRGGFAAVAYELRKVLEARLYHRCDRIVVEIESDAIDVRRLYGGDLEVLVEPNTLESWNPALARKLPESLGGPFDYLCIGRFNYQKGQDRWIAEIARRVSCGENPGRTLFVGDGEMLAKCKDLVRRLHVCPLCSFSGAIPDVEKYLKCVPVVVSPSRWEGMPYLMMKARALGCRILATDCPGNRDVLAGYEKWEKLEL